MVEEQVNYKFNQSRRKFLKALLEITKFLVSWNFFREQIYRVFWKHGNGTVNGKALLTRLR